MYLLLLFDTTPNGRLQSGHNSFLPIDGRCAMMRHSRICFLVLSLLVAVVTVAGCAKPSLTPIPAPVETPAPAETPAPTSTPVPTLTPTPEEMPTPTPTPPVTPTVVIPNTTVQVTEDVEYGNAGNIPL